MNNNGKSNYAIPIIVILLLCCCFASSIFGGFGGWFYYRGKSECKENSDCSDPNTQCVGGKCVTQCANNSECTNPNFPKCYNGTCVQCALDSHCTESPNTKCITSIGVCKECLSDNDCKTSPKTKCSPNYQCVDPSVTGPVAGPTKPTAPTKPTEPVTPTTPSAPAATEDCIIHGINITGWKKDPRPNASATACVAPAGTKCCNSDPDYGCVADWVPSIFTQARTMQWVKDCGVTPTCNADACDRIMKKLVVDDNKTFESNQEIAECLGCAERGYHGGSGQSPTLQYKKNGQWETCQTPVDCINKMQIGSSNLGLPTIPQATETCATSYGAPINGWFKDPNSVSNCFTGVNDLRGVYVQKTGATNAEIEDIARKCCDGNIDPAYGCKKNIALLSDNDLQAWASQCVSGPLQARPAPATGSSCYEWVPWNYKQQPFPTTALGNRRSPVYINIPTKPNNYEGSWQQIGSFNFFVPVVGINSTGQSIPGRIVVDGYWQGQGYGQAVPYINTSAFNTPSGQEMNIQPEVYLLAVKDSDKCRTSEVSAENTTTDPNQAVTYSGSPVCYERNLGFTPYQNNNCFGKVQGYDVNLIKNMII